jgi:vancomycin resistance protein VanJ
MSWSHSPDTFGMMAAVSSGSATLNHSFLTWAANWIRWTLYTASWFLLIGVLTQGVLIRWLGDLWWPATILMFAPRWPLSLPILAVGTVCAFVRPKLILINVASALLLLGPVMGFCVPNSFSRPAVDGFPIRILTANIGGGVNIDLLRTQIRIANPDVMTFQESPTQVLEEPAKSDWHWQSARGLLVGSRFPILETNVLEGSIVGRYHDNGLRIHVRTPAGDVWICCVYLDSPRNGFESLMVTRRGIFGGDEMRKNTQHRSELSGLVCDWVSKVDGPRIVAGDMNQPAESYFYRRDWSSWDDAYAAVGLGYGHTWFSSWHGLRIDHILVDKHWRVTGCHVAGFTGGDHRPVVADLTLSN